MEHGALAERNAHLVRAFQAPSLRENLRRALLDSAARLPIAMGKFGSRRILVIRPDHLGDVLLTIPALRALRRAQPNAEIHALVGTWSAEVLAPITEIDMVLTLAFPGFAREAETGGIAEPYILAHQTARKLRRIGYDQAIILRRDHWWGALVAFLAGIPIRVGTDVPNVQQFLTHAHPDVPGHAVVNNYRLVRPLGAGSTPPEQIDYPVSDEARLAVNALLRDRGVDPNGPYGVIHVGSGAAVKNWEAERWAVVASALAGGLGGPIVLTGSSRETADADAISAAVPEGIVKLVGQTDLPALAALYAGARIVLGADSGPLHLAAAVGVPTVTLFGPADPDEFRPWGNPERQRIVTYDIGCRPCRILDWGGDDLAFHPCVRAIQPRHVIEAAWRAINAT